MEYLGALSTLSICVLSICVFEYLGALSTLSFCLLGSTRLSQGNSPFLWTS